MNGDENDNIEEGTFEEGSNEEVTESYIYEYWDCPQCNQKKIRGDVKTCNQCGNPRDKNITFYTAEQEEVVEQEEQAEEFAAGPDWLCSYCDTLNSATKQSCRGCGTERSKAEKNYFENQQHQQERAKEKKREPEKSTKGGGRIVLAVALAGSLLFGGICYYLNKTVKVDYKVSSVQYSIKVPVQRYSYITDSSWKDEMSGNDIEILSQNRKQRGTKQVQKGYRQEFYTENVREDTGRTRKKCQTSYKSTGSGAGKKVKTCRDVAIYRNKVVKKSRQIPNYVTVPVYGKWVRYKAKKYASYKTFKSTGKSNTVTEPKVKLEYGLEQKKDKASDAVEKYRATLNKVKSKDDGPKQIVYKLNRQEYSKVFLKGSTQPIVIDVFGKVDDNKDRVEK